MTFQEAVTMHDYGHSILKENPMEGGRLIKEAEVAFGIKYHEHLCDSCVHTMCPFAPEQDDGGMTVESCRMYEDNV